MALGTMTLNEKAIASGSCPSFQEDFSFPGDGAYPTGGTVGFQALVRAATGVKEARTVQAVVDISGGATYYPVYDRANDKLKVFVRATGVEVADTTNLSATTFRVLVLSW